MATKGTRRRTCSTRLDPRAAHRSWNGEHVASASAVKTKRPRAGATSAGEQATGLSQINSAVNQMDQITQQNAAMVEQAAAAAYSLKDQFGALSDLVGTFRTPDAGAGTPLARRAA